MVNYFSIYVILLKVAEAIDNISEDVLNQDYENDKTDLKDSN